MSQQDYDPPEDDRSTLQRLWEFLLGPHETQRKVTIRLILVILLAQGVFELRETQWGAELLDVLGEALDRTNNNVAQVRAALVSGEGVAPQGLLDIQNLNLQLGSKSAENEALRQELALAQTDAAELRRALGTAREAMNAATEACIATTGEDADVSIEEAADAARRDALSDRLDRALGVQPP
jgi:hypothetical protein